ncbi:MAG: VIT family protein [Gammaproteobacteria bacterium]|nr:VIT family protein [Gammaproteobacteria bacterium]
MNHNHEHRSHRKGWLRAAVMGANDGIVSTASLLVGVASANAAQADILLAGSAGLVAGAMSMAAGEYVSVCSQADAERADLALEQQHINDYYEFEHSELTNIYIGRGLKHELAAQVATELMEHDALGAHARDELGIMEISSAQPLQAALASAGTFTIGAFVPLLAAILTSGEQLVFTVATLALACLFVLGGLAARTGGGNMLVASTRVTFWGALAMLITYLVGYLFDIIV